MAAKAKGPTVEERYRNEHRLFCLWAKEMFVRKARFVQFHLVMPFGTATEFGPAIPLRSHNVGAGPLRGLRQCFDKVRRLPFGVEGVVHAYPDNPKKPSVLAVGHWGGIGVKRALPSAIGEA